LEVVAGIALSVDVEISPLTGIADTGIINYHKIGSAGQANVGIIDIASVAHSIDAGITGIICSVEICIWIAAAETQL
jgi:hypothetical protein